MELLGPNAIRESLSKLANEIENLSKNGSALEQSIAMNRRKNGLLSKDVQELKRRTDDQTNLLNREENKIFKNARELAEIEDEINQIEVELVEMTAEKTNLQNELNSRIETIKEGELLLGLYEGCVGIFK
ncbi:uncharacterized protein NESG_01997 [Nematocida ausubeli]|uniref:Uncharacterized protein n=1 Tax=Nematocida ausubeli (strain ATCC PRA-371 / ERTm2) TaxID=1913371 RepID=H8ZD09_NEMA1|nr:uncharacterized protein NESG_01997 [Nematocida ausubeli]EHY65549.1 hypothetical protein NERG_01156 [Nematocida ausubeli]KAI5137685.1 hypothetical protein NEAUS06_2317 [Nematocida ausubeli]KAI5150941.1 hypothetical protein NEAUS05_2347 [Nematocida ausubeli]KFG25228.1 hypothetical protein NESG_01997 [Nematocida ausubeli]